MYSFMQAGGTRRPVRRTDEDLTMTKFRMEVWSQYCETRYGVFTITTDSLADAEQQAVERAQLPESLTLFVCGTNLDTGIGCSGIETTGTLDAIDLADLAGEREAWYAEDTPSLDAPCWESR